MTKWTDLKCTCEQEQLATELCPICVAYMNGIMDERRRVANELNLKMYGPLINLDHENEYSREEGDK